MTKHSVCPFLIPLALLCTALPAFGAAETLPCADRSVTASAVHTPEDVKSFVQCAYEFVQETRISILALARPQYTPAPLRTARPFTLNPAHHLCW